MSKNKNISNISLAIFSSLLLLTVFSCVEPYFPKTTIYEQNYVVQGIITSEIKYQEIRISETYLLEDDTVSYVNNAAVRVVDSDNNEFPFQIQGAGKYVSIEEFGAKEGVSYHLEFEVDGKQYQSDDEMITGTSQLSNVEAKRIVNEGGEVGVGIFANSQTSTESSKFYRYTYSETYKIVSPYTSDKKFIINSNGFAVLVDVDPNEEREVCYNTVSSQSGVLSNTTLLNSNNQQDVLVQFIPINTRKIQQRYSINVEQNVLSGEAFTYFQTLDDLSNSESVFSQNQPGFVQGNIFSVNDPDENVVGYFEVAGASSKRIYFNFEDIFSEEERPDPTDPCTLVRPLPGLGFEPGDIDNVVAQGEAQYVRDAPPSTDPLNPQGPYLMVNIECIDCKTIGTPVKPDFWIDNNQE